jgi:hypothetical protein
VKCGRCLKDVPVLTPSPDGDQDLCSDCYAEVYRRSHAARKFPKLPVIAAVVAAVLVVGVVYAFMRKDSSGEVAEAPKTEGTALTGPNKPDPRKTQPAKKPAPKPGKNTSAPTTVPPAKTEEEKSEEPAAKPDEQPAEPPAPTDAKKEETPPPENKTEPPQPRSTAIETAQFVLTPGSVRQAGQISVSVHAADGQATTHPLAAPELETLFEVAVNLKPTDENGLVIAGLSLRVGETPYIPIQARAFSSPYLAPSDQALILSESATVSVSFGAEQESATVSERGDELVVTRKDKPTVIPITFLFALPKDVDASGGAAIVLPEGEVPVALK